MYVSIHACMYAGMYAHSNIAAIHTYTHAYIHKRTIMHTMHTIPFSAVPHAFTCKFMRSRCETRLHRREAREVHTPKTPGIRCRQEIPHVSVRPCRFSQGFKNEYPYADKIPPHTPVSRARPGLRRMSQAVPAHPIRMQSLAHPIRMQSHS